MNCAYFRTVLLENLSYHILDLFYIDASHTLLFTWYTNFKQGKKTQRLHSMCFDFSSCTILLYCTLSWYTHRRRHFSSMIIFHLWNTKAIKKIYSFVQSCLFLFIIFKLNRWKIEKENNCCCCRCFCCFEGKNVSIKQVWQRHFYIFLVPEWIYIHWDAIYVWNSLQLHRKCRKKINFEILKWKKKKKERERRIFSWENRSSQKILWK